MYKRQLYASRGFEYGVHRQSLVVRRGDSLKIECSLEREVDTRGWIAADTHIHTRTFSGHGDATLEETMLSIAGEGIELAVATDHNTTPIIVLPRRPWAWQNTSPLS